MKTGRLICTLLALTITSGCATTAKWDAGDKALGGALVAVNVIDWKQTRQIARNPDRWYEKNPTMRRHPSTSDVDTHFLAVVASELLIADLLDHPARKWFLGANAAIEFYYVRQNAKLGISISW